MSWEERGPRAFANVREGIAAAVTDTKILISFYEDVANPCRLRAGDRMMLIVGRGEDARKLRLVRDPRGYTLTPIGRGRPSVRLAARFWPDGPCVKSAVRAVEYRVLEQGRLELILPPEFYPPPRQTAPLSPA